MIAAASLAIVLAFGCNGSTEARTSEPPTSASQAPHVVVAGAGRRRASVAGCSSFASPRGSDRLPGTRGRPFRSVPRLLRSLRAGQTGCLMPGRYSHKGVAKMRRPRTGLRGLGGRGRVRVDGPIWVLERATGARLGGLWLTSSDERLAIPLKIQADRVRVAGNYIYGMQSKSCVLIGSQRRTHGVRIERNVISRCGTRDKFDHLIYVADAVGTVISRNVLIDNPGGWAVHLYPDANRSLIEHNVMDGNHGGVLFGGDGRQTSDENVVRFNAITSSSPRRNIESSWARGQVGTGNKAYRNCVYSTGADRPAGIGQLVGFGALSNVVLNRSPYVARRRGDYRFRRDSRCAKLVRPLKVTLRRR